MSQACCCPLSCSCSTDLSSHSSWDLREETDEERDGQKNDKKGKYWKIKGDSTDRKPEMTFLNGWKEKEIEVKADK